MSNDWNHLGAEVEKRRTSMGHTQETLVAEINELVGRSVISTSTLRLIENARQDAYRRITLSSLERGLAWPPGSIDRLLAGETPDPSWDTRLPDAVAFDSTHGDDTTIDVAHLPPEMRERARAFIAGMTETLGTNHHPGGARPERQEDLHPDVENESQDPDDWE